MGKLAMGKFAKQAKWRKVRVDGEVCSKAVNLTDNNHEVVESE
jgi:hypothetical protein